MFASKRSVAILFERIERLEQKDRCAVGSHVWETRMAGTYDPPYIACKFCGERPKVK